MPRQKERYKNDRSLFTSTKNPRKRERTEELQVD